MKKNILFLVIGFVLAFSTAATTGENIFVAKPAQPKAVFVDWFTVKANAVSAIQDHYKKGYIVKDLSASEGYFIVVMEKY
jgi:hypothetical protein